LKKVDQKQQTQITEEEREAIAAEMVNSFFTILTLVTWNINFLNSAHERDQGLINL